MLAEGTYVGRDFRIVRLIDEGGMGAVYEAQQISTGQRRALKVMHDALLRDPKSRERFDREVRATSQIESDHVVQIISAGVDDVTSMPFLVMEYLVGETLALRLARLGRLARSEVATVFEQLCHALEAAHRQGIVHRDLKPQNIFLAAAKRSKLPFTVKLLDFGIAKWLQEQHTSARNSQLIGTPEWMAPEQANPGQKIRPATDVWALGLLAFWMLIGKSYWRTAEHADASIHAWLREVIMDPLPAASYRAHELAFDGAIPEGFDDWFSRCVTRDIEARFRDASEAIAVLQPILLLAPPATVQQGPLFQEQVGTAAHNSPLRTVAASQAELALAVGLPAEVPASTPVQRTNSPLAAITSCALLVIAVWATIVAAFLYVETLVISGPLLAAVGIMLGVTGRRDGSGRLVFLLCLSAPIACIFCFALVLSNNWSPAEARTPILGIGTAYGVFTTVFCWVYTRLRWRDI